MAKKAPSTFKKDQSPSLRALIVDDYPQDRQLISRELQKEFPGIEVIEIKNKTELSQALRRGDFNLVVTEYKLHWTTGMEVLKKAKKKCPYCAVVMFTASGNEEVAVEAMKQGLDDYVLKSSGQYLRLPVALRGALKKMEQKKMIDEIARKLRESERRYRTLTENINDIIYSLNPEGVITYISPQVEKYGYKPQDFLGKHLSELAENMVPEDQAKMMDDFLQAVKGGEERLTEYRFVSPEGKVYWLENYSRIQRNKKGQVTGVIGVLRDITEAKKTQEELQKSLREKEILLREIYHRVKNNMQIMASLLRLQARQAQDERTKELFRESQARIRTMALVHERLYQSEDLSSIDFSDYINHMAVHLMSLYHEKSRNIDLEIKSQGVYLDINRAIPCALLLNELITNVLKHAFPQNQPGKLTIVLEKRPRGKYYLLVEDNGVGLSPEIDIKKAETLGLQLINDLTIQLGGQLRVFRNQGTAFEVIF